MIVSCGSRKERDGSDVAPPSLATDTNERVEISNLYASVGEIQKNGRHLCSGVIVSHGLFATAKHCFRNYAGSSENLSYSIHFSTTGIIDDTGVTVDGVSISAITFDDATDDIAYIHYSREATERLIAIDCADVARTTPLAGQSVHLVGYPSPTGVIMRRLVSKGCHMTGKTGTLPAMPQDPGYDGLLYDTDCRAWYGNSGGPVFAVDTSGRPTSLLGVVTHTFDVTANGSLDVTKEDKDGYGQHVTSTNISPFSLAKNLPAALLAIVSNPDNL